MFRIIWFCLLLNSLCANAKHQTIYLQKALDAGLVKASAYSLGGHQGFCMRIVLINTSKDSLVVLVETGRRLNSLEDREQDILLVKEERVALRGFESKGITVKGYCCQASHACPSRNAKYGLNTLADSNLVTLARYLSSVSFDSGIEQYAVWSLSDNRPSATITSRNDSLALPLRCMVARIKGEQLPWYTVVSGTYMYASGVIAVFPLTLKGKLEYTLGEGRYVTLRIVDGKGLPVCFMRNEWLDAVPNGSYDLNIPVKGLAKGKYTVELVSREKQLVKKEFEI